MLFEGCGLRCPPQRLAAGPATARRGGDGSGLGAHCAPTLHTILLHPRLNPQWLEEAEEEEDDEEDE
jgi:hypothetical protein